jgi:23S rRNA-/tRNA-specific pseudouridylate synthase
MNHKATRCQVLFEDDVLLIVNKPAGVLSHPNPHPQRNAFKRAKAGKSGIVPKSIPMPRCAFEGDYDFGNRCFSAPGGPIWLIHRLDQDASGALLAAKNPVTAKKCRLLFERFQVDRAYLALLLRQPEPQRGRWHDHMAEQKRPKFIRSFVEPRKRPNSEVMYRVKRYFPRLRMSLVEFNLVTGKTHQIRVQSAAHGYPVAGDGVYGNFKFNRKLRKEIGLRRLFLHAHELKMKHPVTNAPMTIESPLPKDLEECLLHLS